MISYCHLVHLFTPKTCTYFCNGEVKAHSGEPQLAACERSQKPEKPGSRWQRSICTQLISPGLFLVMILITWWIRYMYIHKHQFCEIWITQKSVQWQFDDQFINWNFGVSKLVKTNDKSLKACYLQKWTIKMWQKLNYWQSLKYIGQVLLCKLLFTVMYVPICIIDPMHL